MKSKHALLAFDALSHRTRLDIFKALICRGKSGMSAQNLCTKMNMAPATLSFHMSKLANGDLVNSKKSGRNISYYAEIGTVKELSEFLMEKCCTEDN